MLEQRRVSSPLVFLNWRVLQFPKAQECRLSRMNVHKASYFSYWAVIGQSVTKSRVSF